MVPPPGLPPPWLRFGQRKWETQAHHCVFKRRTRIHQCHCCWRSQPVNCSRGEPGRILHEEELLSPEEGGRSSPRECPAQEMAHAYGSPLGRAGSDEECVFWSSVPNWRTLRTRRRPRGCWQPAKRRGPSLGISWLSVPLMLRRDFTNSRFQQIRFVAAGELWGK